MDTVLGNKLIELRARIVQSFDHGNWEELGLLTGATEFITSHPRLLRSLSFNDLDYDGHVLTVLRIIIEEDPRRLAIIESYIDKNFPGDSTYISAKPAERRVTFSPNVFQLPDVYVELDLVAVMMPFAMEFSGVFGAIRRATSACGLRCIRADDIWEDSVIVQDIFNIIFRAQVIIVDFTGKNPNVMYETGIAHTLGKHVIPISQSLDDVPFDIRHHRVLKYLPNAEGLIKLSSDLYSKLRQSAVGIPPSAKVPAQEEDDIPF